MDWKRQRRFTSLLFWICTGALHSILPAVVTSKAVGCPADWLEFSTSCYLFHKFMPVSREDAIFQCGTHGGGLVSVKEKKEHDFLVKWLQLHDKELQTWYTSGFRYVTGQGAVTLTWQSTGEIIPEDLMNSIGYEFNHTSGALVYTHTESGYQWGTRDSSEVLPYICEVPLKESYRIVQNQRDYDYGLPTSDVSTIDKGPHFLVQPVSTVVVGDPESVTLECVGTAKPVPVYSWWKGDNLDIPVTQENDPRYVITNGKLVIKNPQEAQDSTMYRCQVENKFGVIISDIVQLSFGALGEFSNVAVAPVRAMAYQGAVIECSRINYNPGIAYQWYKNSALQFVRPQYQKYIFISQSGKLYFSEVTSADEGQYYCIAVLTGRGQHAIGISQPPTRTSLPISLLVSDQAPLVDWGPEIQDEFIAVFPNPPLRGQNVRLECFAYGSAITEFRYSWTREGKSLPHNAVLMDHNRVLLLRDASLDDQGIYSCSVSRGSSAKDQRSIDLKLGSKPYFITTIGDQHQDLGAQFTWHCDVRSSPASTFQWYKNGKTLTSDPQLGIQVVNNVLRFSKLDPKLHDGMYQCAATNTHGTTLNEGQLRVLAFAPTFTKIPMQSETRAPLYGNLTLACRPEAAPLPKITWLKDGVDLPLMAGVYEQQLNGNLIVRGIQEGSGGRYTCRAVNSLGEAEDSTIVSIAAGTYITVPPQDQRAFVNSTAFFSCFATHAEEADLLYTWYFNGFLIDPRRQPEYEVVQENTFGKTGLYIHGVSLHHSGYYECRAITTINSDSRTAYLSVVGPPAQPAGVFIDSTSVTESSIVVRWTEISSPDRNVLRYIVQSQSEFDGSHWETAISDIASFQTVHQSEDKRYANVTGLNPGCAYRFRIIAVNEVGRGLPSAPTAYVLMLSAAPQLSPLHVGGGGGHVGVLTMAWEPLTKTQQGGAGIGYIVYWRKKRTTKLKDERWRRKRLLGNVNHYVNVEGVKNYYLEYEVKVQAFNHAGHGPNSSVVTVMSAEDLPASTPNDVNADGFNGTAMEVTWTPVPDTREAAKGKILGYQINYWHEEDDPNLHMKFIRHEGQIDSGIVIGLKSDNFYYFTVQVYNSAGLGPISEFFFQETLHAPAFTYPQEVRLYSAGGYKVQVWWRGITISQPESSIKGYVIYYWPAHENHRTAKQKVIEERLAFRAIIQVEPGVVYAVRVSAFSDGGLGKKSPTQYFTLEGNNILIDFNLARTVESFLSASTAARFSSTAASYWTQMSASMSFILLVWWNLGFSLFRQNDSFNKV